MKQIREVNIAWSTQQSYPDHNPNSLYHRFCLRPSDTITLRRIIERELRIDTRRDPALNLDTWLNPTSKFYKPSIAASVAHYHTRAEQGERLQVTIVTPEMKEATWEYAHKSQVMLDGTFGVCSSKMLLFILMGVDGAWKGVPLALFLFSAPSGNQSTSAGYNTEVLTRLLVLYKAWLGLREQQEWESKVFITDTHMKERGAILNVWKGLFLLLCHFHWKQFCKNKLVQLLGLASQQKDVQKRKIRRRLGELGTNLIDTLHFTNAQNFISKGKKFLRKTLLANPSLDTPVMTAFEPLAYFDSFWMAKTLWQSWSLNGRKEAEQRLRSLLNKFEVLTTTNHLESFNNDLKRRYLASHTWNGHRLCFDMLIHVLIHTVLLSLFATHHHSWANMDKTQAVVADVPGALEQLDKMTTLRNPFSNTALSYCKPNVQQDQEAHNLLNLIQGTNYFSVYPIVQPYAPSTSSPYNLCPSDIAALGAQIYPLSTKLGGPLNAEKPYHTCTCTCRDSRVGEGACKHQRLLLDYWNTHLSRLFPDFPPLFLPTSRDNALTLLAQQVTPPTVPSLSFNNNLPYLLCNPQAAVDLPLFGGEGSGVLSEDWIKGSKGEGGERTEEEWEGGDGDWGWDRGRRMRELSRKKVRRRQGERLLGMRIF